MWKRNITRKKNEATRFVTSSRPCPASATLTHQHDDFPMKQMTPLIWPGITALLALLVIFIPHWIAPGYYFDDDVRHYFMPWAHEVGTRIVLGDWPTLSLRSMYAGNLIGEGQLGLFNPITLLLYFIVSRIENLGDGALVFAGFHLLAMALGIYTVGRLFKLTRPFSVLAGIAFITSSMTSYWYAATWIIPLAINTWLIWAIAAWLYAFEKPNRLWIAVLATTALTGGWPHGSIALGVILLFLCIDRCRVCHSRQPLLWLAVGGISALLMSLPAIVPLAAHVAESQRGHLLIANNGNLSATVDNLLAFSWPSYLAAWPHYFSHPGAQPNYYVAWFILPLLLSYRRQIRLYWKNPCHSFRLLVSLAAIFALLSLGPEQLGPLRWPFRFVPFFQLFLLLAVLSLASTEPPRSLSTPVLALLWAIGFILCWQQQPAGYDIHAAFALIGFLATRYGFPDRGLAMRPAVLLGATVLIFALMHFFWPQNGNVGHWSTPLQGHYEATPATRGNTLILQRTAAETGDAWKYLPSGNIALWENRPFVNGYSPVESPGLKQLFCFNMWTWACPDSVAKLFTFDPLTAKDYAALLRIDEIRVAYGSLSRAMENIAPNHGFQKTQQSPYSTIWNRIRPPNLSGSVSWVSPGISIGKGGTFTPERETLYITNSGATSGQILFARTPFNGYEALLAGTPLPVSAHERVLLAVTIPAGTRGTLEINYRPVGWRWTSPLAILGLALAIIFSKYLRFPLRQHRRL